MGRRKRKNRGQEAVALDTCRESIRSVKRRYKDAKEDLKVIMDLIDNGAIYYDCANEVVGAAYSKVYAAKHELKARKKG